MTSMLERSARLIDGEEDFESISLMHPAAEAAEEIAPGVALIEAFSNVAAFTTGDGLVLFDVSHQLWADGVLAALRQWSDQRVDTAVYTHGHVDHVTGAQTFVADAAARGDQPIRFVGHEAVPARFDRYVLTNGYNGHINMRQFRLPAPAFPSDFVRPDETLRSELDLDVGGRHFALFHARGETDDHVWGWVPDCRAVCVGDFFIWQFPNAGNPQKAQRYAWDWAVALRAMAALEPELLVPAHGMAINGTDRVRRVLTDTAAALESLHEQTLALMNLGARLDDVLHTVRLPDELAALPYLRPTYDEPEFVVRNLWRLYGGWYDGNPAHLKPARDRDLARELATLAGGADALAARAEALASDGDLRVACHLAELAVLAEPESPRLHAARAAVYDVRRHAESSLMATGIYRSAALESRAHLDAGD